MRLNDILSILPDLLSHLTLERAQLVIDQLRAAIERSSPDPLRIIGVSVAETAEAAEAASPAAVAAAVMPPGSDAATILFAGATERLRQASPEACRDVVDRLGASLEEHWRGRGIRFVQWATDPPQPSQVPRPAGGSSGPHPAQWPQAWGMSPIGTLLYLTLQFDSRRSEEDLRGCERSTGEGSAGVKGLPQPLSLSPLDWSRPEQIARFTQLIELTYQATRDCPRLSEFRSAEEIATGYREARAFDPGGWFFVGGEGDRDHLGVLVLARHGATSAASDRSDAEPEPGGCATELVYMGLVPEARRRGWGGGLLASAIDVAQRRGDSRLILAVDEANAPARRLYERAGMAPVMRETVYVRRLER